MWQFVFWFTFGVVAYSYLGYPLLLFIISKLKNGRRHLADDTGLPNVCLVISAFNEEKMIRKKIENSLELDYPRDKLTVLVASDGSDDDTVAITREFETKGVKLFHRPAREGKSAVLNDVVNRVAEEIIVFTDANALFCADALTKLARHFSNPDIGCVVGKLRYVDRHTSGVGKGEGLYWRYEGMLSVLESSLRSVLVANGSIFAIRRMLFSELYPEVANDFQIPMDVASRGYGTIYEPDAVALERSTIHWQEEFQRKVRIILRGLTGFRMMRDQFRGFRLWQFFSHKLLRWSAGPLLFFTLLANVMLMEGSAFYTTVFWLQVGFYLAAINGWRIRRARKPHPLFYLPFYFTMVNLAAVIATSKFLSGERQTTWDKAESARFAPAGKVEVAVVRPVRVSPVPGEQPEPTAVPEKVAKS
jgi:cellulose synthase/poly-beta-1,6-N-acetylglucosamine synthase-like glycosyltransferase